MGMKATAAEYKSWLFSPVFPVAQTFIRFHPAHPVKLINWTLWDKRETFINFGRD